MPRLITKHGEREKIIDLPDFSGGLNFLVNPESIADNELQQAENWEYDYESGALKTVDGVRELYDTGLDIGAFFYDQIHNKLMFTSGLFLYSTDLTTKTFLGGLSGTKKPVFVPFGKKILIASGGQLQYYDGVSLNTINSPECDIVFERFGRVVIAKTGKDYLYYSGVGDETNWTENSSDDSSAKSLEIGYKDSGDIVAIAALVPDMLVFKSSKKVYRVMHEFPDWEVREISRNVDCHNAKAVFQVGNNVFAMGKDGFISLQTVTEYGDVKIMESGAKINQYLLKNANFNDCQIWHVPTKQQIWLKTQNDNVIWLYHYATGAFTVRKFMTGQVNDLFTKDLDVYVAVGSKICILDDKEANECGIPIQAALRTKIFVANNDYLIKKVTVNTYNILAGYGIFSLGRINIPLEWRKGSHVAYYDTETAYNNTDMAVNIPLSSTSKRSAYRNKSFECRIFSVGGAVSIRGIKINVVEV